MSLPLFAGFGERPGCCEVEPTDEQRRQQRNGERVFGVLERGADDGPLARLAKLLDEEPRRVLSPG
jgi:hypothetical protein